MVKTPFMIYGIIVLAAALLARSVSQNEPFEGMIVAPRNESDGSDTDDE